MDEGLSKSRSAEAVRLTAMAIAHGWSPDKVSP